MENDQIERLFERASRLDESKMGYHNEAEWKQLRFQSGAIHFKRKAMGFCGSSSVKSLDEIAYLFVKTGIAISQDDGKEIAEALNGKEIKYNSTKMSFNFVKDTHGNLAYRIEAYVPSD